MSTRVVMLLPEQDRLRALLLEYAERQQLDIAMVAGDVEAAVSALSSGEAEAILIADVRAVPEQDRLRLASLGDRVLYAAQRPPARRPALDQRRVERARVLLRQALALLDDTRGQKRRR
jgi:hypothetical protein